MEITTSPPPGSNVVGEIEYWKLVDTVYRYNYATCVMSTYTVSPSGFIISYTRYTPEALRKNRDTVAGCQNRNGFRSQVMSEAEFQQFWNVLQRIEAQAHELKPIVTFEEHISIMASSFGLKLKKENDQYYE